ncbi:g4443 [Coccomyxa viridis]|uniref:phosphopantothenoylcysteine decarboxylase n=1 Tax=Coccomyxa viridis TaxID=1274662 RepID=A0ABP1FQA0_9CHLO
MAHEHTPEEPPSASGRDHKRPRVLLGVSGSVAAIKVPIIAKLLSEFCEVIVIATDASRKLLHVVQLEAMHLPVKGDEEEWREWKEVGDPVLHIELRRWADCLVIAPLSANTLAKCAQGLCDNLLTCVFRAWDFSRPLLVAPAMNTFMWDSPFTGAQLEVLQKLGVSIIPPISKKLACGDVGNGALAEPAAIAEAVRGAIFPQKSRLQEILLSAPEFPVVNEH